MKKNINCKKAISRVFTAVTLFTILAGNSSFIAQGIGQTLEKTRQAMIEMIPIGEEIIAVKISTPSRSMIRKADREIHLNMNQMIKELNSFQISIHEANSADKEINDQFNSSYAINTDWDGFDNGDISLTAQFDAENISLELMKYMHVSDNQIIKQFYLNNYSTFNPTNITATDALITETFCSENN